MGDAFSTFGADETDDGCTGFSPFYAGSWLEGIPELYSVSLDFLKTGKFIGSEGAAIPIEVTAL